MRAAYVPDAVTGTRWFADRMVWVQDGQELLPFATRESADEYLDEHAGAEAADLGAGAGGGAR